MSQLAAYTCGPNLTETQEREIFAILKRNPYDAEAREQLIASNIRLIMKLARRYSANRRSLTFEDLVQEGIEGLLHAMSRFKQDRGCRFNTYGLYWANQRMLRAIENQDRFVRIPIALHRSIAQLPQNELLLTYKLGHPPTTEELAQEIGISVERTKAMLVHNYEPSSYDDRLPSSEESLLSTIRDPQALDPAEMVINSSQNKVIRRRVDQLEPLQREVIIRRYGLEDGTSMSLKDLAEVMKRSIEGIRLIERRALRKLKILITKDS